MSDRVPLPYAVDIRSGRRIPQPTQNHGHRAFVAHAENSSNPGKVLRLLFRFRVQGQPHRSGKAGTSSNAQPKGGSIASRNPTTACR